MLKTIKRMLVDLRLVRMSDGHLALVRDLGLVKGGRGLRQHEALLSLNTQAVSITSWMRIAKPRNLLADGVNPASNYLRLASGEFSKELRTTK